MNVRTLVVAATLAALLVVPASASAAPLLRVKLTRDSVRYGAEHRITGTLLDGTTPVAGQEIVLEGRRYPYQGSDRVITRTTTDAKGEFTLRAELDRNHRLRVTAPAVAQTSPVLRAYVLPEFELSFRALRPGVVRLYQRYTVPRSVRLKSPTLFYLGPRRAERATRRVSADVRAHTGRQVPLDGRLQRPGCLERRLPLRELLPRLAGFRHGRSGPVVPASAARVLVKLPPRRRSKLIEVGRLLFTSVHVRR